MEWLVIYLLVQIEVISSMLGKFASGLIPVGLGLIFLTVMACGLSAAEGSKTFSDLMAGNYAKKALGWAKTCIVVGLLSALMAGLLPTQKNMAIIVGSGVVYNVVTSDSAQRLGSKAIGALEKKIDEILTEEDDVSQAKPTKAQAQTL